MNFTDATRGCFLYAIYTIFVRSAKIRKSVGKRVSVILSVSSRRDARSRRRESFFFATFAGVSLARVWRGLTWADAGPSTKRAGVGWGD